MVKLPRGRRLLVYHQEDFPDPFATRDAVRGKEVFSGIKPANAKGCNRQTKRWRGKRYQDLKLVMLAGHGPQPGMQGHLKNKARAWKNVAAGQSHAL